MVIDDAPVAMTAVELQSMLGRYLQTLISQNRYLRLQGIRSVGRLVNMEIDRIYVTLRANLTNGPSSTGWPPRGHWHSANGCTASAQRRRPHQDWPDVLLLLDECAEVHRSMEDLVGGRGAIRVLDTYRAGRGLSLDCPTDVRLRF